MERVEDHQPHQQGGVNQAVADGQQTGAVAGGAQGH